jgi:long-chain acyl-CoA synthetase
VMLTHENFVSCVHLADWFEFSISENDSSISYLPYGHTFE